MNLFNLMKEERRSTRGCKNNDLVEVADALGDMLHILCGTIIEHGMQDKIDEVFAELKSNMSSWVRMVKQFIVKTEGLKRAKYFKPNINPLKKKRKIKKSLKAFFYLTLCLQPKYLSCYCIFNMCSFNVLSKHLQNWNFKSFSFMAKPNAD